MTYVPIPRLEAIMFDLTRDWVELPSRKELLDARGHRELDFPPPPEVQPPWDIPELVVITAAVSGRIAREADSEVARSFPLDFDSFQAAAVEALEAGACGVHVDFGGISAIQESGLSVTEAYDRLLTGISDATKVDWIRDVNVLRGRNFAENVYPIAEGLAETCPMAPNFPVEWMESVAQVVADRGAKLFFSTHSTAEVELADRLVLQKGILPGPSAWIILIGYPYDDSTDRLTCWLANPKAMMTELIQIVERIRELDADAFIQVCAAGRASHYLATTAMLLGLHVRVGTEDTIWRYPHKNELLSGSAEMVERAKITAEVLGRRLASPAECRQLLGLQPARPAGRALVGTKGDVY